MIKVKVLAVFAAMIGVLAVSAAPAFAEFKSNSSATTGAGKSGAIVLEGGGATLECTSAEGEWAILATPGGAPATQGANMQIKTSKWNGCTAKSSIIKGVAAVVKPCVLELKQAAGETKAKGSTVTECTVEVKVLGTCTIKVPAGQTGLEKNLLENVGENLLTHAEDSGITTKPSSACLGIKATTEGKQKGIVTGVGLKEV